MTGIQGKIWLLLVASIQLWSFGSAAKNVYYMDSKLDCSYIGTQGINRDETVIIVGRAPGSTTMAQTGCTLNFRALESTANLILTFTKYAMKSCSVTLYLNGDASGQQTAYGCTESNPKDYFSVGRIMTITVHKTDINDVTYNFSATLTAKRESQYPPPGDSNPMAVGMVVGIVGSVFAVIFLVSCVGICCFRKHRVRGPTRSPYLYDPDSKVKLEDPHSPTSVGFYNESARFNGSPMSKKKLLARSESSSDEKNSSERNNRPRELNLNRNKQSVPPPPPPPTVDQLTPNRDSWKGKNGFASQDSDNKRTLSNERSVDVDSGRKNPMLSALKNNNKFKETFKSTEAEAEERAKRISSSSFENFGEAPTPPSSSENVSRPSLPPVPKSPKGRRPKHATISRNPRPTSMSSEELEEIERGRPRDDDTNIKVHYTDSSSPASEVVPIKVKQDAKQKTNTTHSLRPDRSKGNKAKSNKKDKTGSSGNTVEPSPKSKKKQTQSVSSTMDPESRYPAQKDSPRLTKDKLKEADRLNASFDSRTSSGRFSKRTKKSPRQARSAGKGFSHRRGRSMDQLDSRPTTPTSAFGSIEDLESLPPLQRARSKDSLYASRSSLYGRRRRKGSNAESLYSYRDDASVHRRSGYSSFSDDDFDGYEKPLSRRDRERLYRSENDLGRGQREISTQTLRETATQTGQDESVVVQQKMLVKKRRRARSVSTSGTQTEKKKNGVNKTKSKAEEKLNNREKTKSKRSKSLNALDVETEDTSDSPKPKPKPKPRKSASSNKLLDSDKKSASVDNLANATPYYPQSEGFVPAGYNPQAGYPGMGPNYPPPPQYPGNPQYPGQHPYMQGIPPPGYNPNMYPQPPQPGMNPAMQPQSQPVPRKPKKSNWELLCEMTDGEHAYDDLTETGSMASSVFTSNPRREPGYQSGPQPPYLTNAYPPPQQQHGNQAYENQQFGPNNGRGQGNQQSSWEALKKMTSAENQPASNRRNESVV